jgi:hypothetical protein
MCSEKNDNLGVISNNTRDNNDNNNMEKMMIVETEENQLDNHDIDINLETEQTQDYPATVLCSEEDDRYNILQARILKEKLIRLNKKPLRLLDTIEEDQDYQTAATDWDTQGFQEIISKKDKRKRKIQAKTIITNTTKSRSIETGKHKETNTKETFVYRKQGKEKYNIENLNSYAPLDPNNHIKPEQYNKLIKARRENCENNNNNYIYKKSNNKVNEETEVEQLQSSSIDTNKTLQIQLDKLTLRQYIIQHKNIGLNKTMPFLTTKSKQIPLMKQLLANERAKHNNGNSPGTPNDKDWNQIGDKKAEQKLLDIYDEYSEIWLPRNLPRTTKVEDKQTIQHTKKYYR